MESSVAMGVTTSLSRLIRRHRFTNLVGIKKAALKERLLIL